MFDRVCFLNPRDELDLTGILTKVLEVFLRIHIASTFLHNQPHLGQRDRTGQDAAAETHSEATQKRFSDAAAAAEVVLLAAGRYIWAYTALEAARRRMLPERGESSGSF
jgi:hypothetical protein